MRTHHAKYTKYYISILMFLILSGVLLGAGNWVTIKTTIAQSTNSHNQTTGKQPQSLLPVVLVYRVLQDVARNRGISAKELKITDYSRQTWRNGCLELPQPGEICTQALVPGWRVVVSNDVQSWIYHTNQNGGSLRVSAQVNLPESVKFAVLQAAAGHLQIPIDNLSIVTAEQRTWTNGCLNLAAPDEMCTQALVPGWRVVVSAEAGNFVYHTNGTGSTVRLNRQESTMIGN